MFTSFLLFIVFRCDLLYTAGLLPFITTSIIPPRLILLFGLNWSWFELNVFNSKSKLQTNSNKQQINLRAELIDKTLISFFPFPSNLNFFAAFILRRHEIKLAEINELVCWRLLSSLSLVWLPNWNDAEFQFQHRHSNHSNLPS